MPERLSLAVAAARVRGGVARAVTRSLATEQEPGILVSGGLDSGAIAALAVRSGRLLRAYSATFPESASADESALIGLLCRRLDLRATNVAFRSGSMLAEGLRYLDAFGLPSVSPNLVWQRPLLGLAAEEGATVLVDGQGGDELFGTPAYLIADRMGRGRVVSAAGLAKQLPGAGERRAVGSLLREYGLRGLLPYWLHRRLRRRGAGSIVWLRPEAATLRASVVDAAVWKRLDGPRWWAELCDAVTSQRERAGAHDFLRHKHALCGVFGTHPLLEDSELVEAVLQLPPELAFDTSHDRPLLRAAVAGVLPEEIRLRTEKAYFSSLFSACLSGPDREPLERLLGPASAEVNAYVRPDVVRALVLDASAERRSGRWAWTAWRLALMEAWLRREADRGFPEHALERWDFVPAVVDLNPRA